MKLLCMTCVQNGAAATGTKGEGDDGAAIDAVRVSEDAETLNESSNNGELLFARKDIYGANP
jgi:hypothetical protein